MSVCCCVAGGDVAAATGAWLEIGSMRDGEPKCHHDGDNRCRGRGVGRDPRAGSAMVRTIKLLAHESLRVFCGFVQALTERRPRVSPPPSWPTFAVRVVASGIGNGFATVTRKSAGPTALAAGSLQVRRGGAGRDLHRRRQGLPDSLSFRCVSPCWDLSALRNSLCNQQSAPLGCQRHTAAVVVCDGAVAELAAGTRRSSTPTYDRMSVVQITPAHPTVAPWLPFTAACSHCKHQSLTGSTAARRRHRPARPCEVPIYPLVQEGGTAAGRWRRRWPKPSHANPRNTGSPTSAW